MIGQRNLHSRGKPFSRTQTNEELEEYSLDGLHRASQSSSEHTELQSCRRRTPVSIQDHGVAHSTPLDLPGILGLDSTSSPVEHRSGQAGLIATRRDGAEWRPDCRFSLAEQRRNKQNGGRAGWLECRGVPEQSTSPLLLLTSWLSPCVRWTPPSAVNV